VFAGPGRYGPYVRRGDDYRSLEDEDQIFTVSLDSAMALLAAPKTRQRRAPAPPLREMGQDPITEKPMVIKDGRFGPYVTDGETNASLRRGQSVEALSVDDASEMLAEKRAKGPAEPRKKATKAAAKKTTAKKAAPAKKATKTTKSTNAAKSTNATSAAKSTGKAASTAKKAAKKAAPKAAPKKA
jgi:DNA topoisomerase-1